MKARIIPHPSAVLSIRKPTCISSCHALQLDCDSLCATFKLAEGSVASSLSCTKAQLSAVGVQASADTRQQLKGISHKGNVTAHWQCAICMKYLHVTIGMFNI